MRHGGVSDNGDVVSVQGDIRFETGMIDSFQGTMTVSEGREIAINSGDSVGAGGVVQLAGTTADPARVTGSTLFLQSGIVPDRHVLEFKIT